MHIIISPAKKMVVDTDSFPVLSQPQYLPQTKQILTALQALDDNQLQTLWHTNDKLTQANLMRLRNMDLTRQLTPALLAYSGIQYQYMAPDVFTTTALEYVQSHLRILSGFYGVLRPFDGVVPYRLEMQAKLTIDNAPNLYAFWGNQLYAAVDDGEPIINLASQEYAKTIQKYIPSERFIDVVFGSFVDGKVKTRATIAKMARGQMVRFMAENQVTTVTQLYDFKEMNYRFVPDLSRANQLVFLDN